MPHGLSPLICNKGGFGEPAAFFLERIFELFQLLGRLVVPFAGRFLVSKLPVSHGQEQPVTTVVAFAERHRLLQRSNRLSLSTKLARPGPRLPDPQSPTKTA